MKKIIASILAIAMVASMFTMVFSANTEEKTNYSEQVEVLDELVDTLLAIGPVMSNKTLTSASNYGYATNDSNKRMAYTMTLADGSTWSSTIYGDLRRFDGRFEDIKDYFDDGGEYPFGGIDMDLLISDEDAFIAEVNNSDAITMVVKAWGYDSVAEAVEALYYPEATSRTEQLKDWKEILPEDIRSTYVGSDNKFKSIEPYGRQTSVDAVAEWLAANEPDMLPAAPAAAEVECSDVLEIFELVISYVASAQYYGTHADAEWFADDFNANRSLVYQIAIDAANDLIDAFRHQVTPYDLPYEEAYAAYADFEWASQFVYGDEVFNESYGINPWIATYGPDFDLISEIGILVGYQWMSFDEIAAYSDKAAQLLTEFQLLLREAFLYDVTGVLYVEFVEKVVTLYETFEALCWELVGGQISSSNKVDYSDIKATFEAVAKLWQLEILYSMYVEFAIDLYAQNVENISTIYNLEGQMMAAREILDRVGYTPSTELTDDLFATYPSDTLIYWENTIKFCSGIQYLIGLDADAVNQFIKNIEANLAKLAPAAGQHLTASEVAKGLALYNKVGNLLDYYAEEAGDIDSYGDLADIYYHLSNYIPAVAGENATAELGFSYYLDPSMDEWVSLVYGPEVVEFKNISYTLEFAPVAYVYLSLLGYVEEVLEYFELEVKYLNTDAPTFAGRTVHDLYDTMKKYDFLTYRLITIKDNEKLDDEDCKLYFYYLTGYGSEDNFMLECVDESAVETELGEYSFLALTIGDPVSYDGYIYDYAVRNYANFYQVFDAIREIGKYWYDYDEGFYEYGDGDKIDFSGDFSILDVVVGDHGSWLDDIIAELEAAAALICVNYTTRVAMYAWVLDELWYHFDFDYDGVKASLGVSTEYTAPDGVYLANQYNYTEGLLEDFADAATALNQLIERYYANNKGEAVYDRATPAKLDAAFKAFKEALYKLFTAKGAACLDVFFAQIERTLTEHVYGSNINLNDPDDVEIVLDDHVRCVEYYIPAEAELRPYDYYAFTLRALASNDLPSNLYSHVFAGNGNGITNFEINFLFAFESATAAVDAIVTGQYPTALREDAAKLAFFANDILYGIDGGDFLDGDWNANNMPLWYALELTAYLQEYAVAAKAQHASALAALKAEVLAPVIAEAETIQTAYVSNPRSLINAYTEACNVNANSADGALYIYDAEAIQAAADALAAEVELAKAELGEAVYTVEDVLTMIDLVVDEVVDRSAGMAIDLKALNVAAANAKTEIAAGDYRQNTHINAVLMAANAALKTLVDVDLADEELYTPASYEAYKVAYDALMETIDINTIVDTTVAEALAVFEAAEANLVLLADAMSDMYDAAVAAYEAALLVDGTKYTADSYAAFTAAVEALKAAIDSYAGDADLQAAIVNVKVAEVQLVAAPISEVGTCDD